MELALAQAGGVGKVTVQRFYRPEDVSREHAYKAEFWELYASDETAALDTDDVFGKCAVVREGAPTGAATSPGMGNQSFGSPCPSPVA